jgi:hypothetical protein
LNDHDVPSIEETSIMASPTGACVTVGKGSVGASGASAQVTHKVGGPTSKIIVLRTVDTSLCPDTGAAALLVVNGIHFTVGRITAKGSSIQTEARPSDQVAAIVHTYPLFNGVTCVWPGELAFILEECQIIKVAARDQPGPTTVVAATSASAPPTRDWHAWNDLMPPGPPRFHVAGEVEVPNPGVEVLLAPRLQGINPRILLLDLHLVERPGLWPPTVVWKPAKYDKVNATYDQVQISFGATLIADLPVAIVT